MISDHEAFPQPSNKSIKLWRYLDLGKFISFLFDRSLYFARLDTLGDPFEGTAPQYSRKMYEDILKKRDTDDGLKFYRDVPEEAIKATLMGIRVDAGAFYANCWHMNEHESDAMWRLYSLSSESVCIQTTYEKLAVALPEEVSMGVVTYIDYEAQRYPTGDPFYAVMYKRASFAHEREVRAISRHIEQNPERRVAGLAIPVDVTSFVEAVYVNPLAPSWFTDIVLRLISSQRLEIPVLESSLKAKPVLN